MPHEHSPALVIVDVQKGFLNESTRPTLSRIRAEQDAHATVIVTRFVNPEGSDYERRLGSQSHRPGSDDCDLVFEPAERATVIEKNTYGLGPERERVLRIIGNSEVTVCGWDTDNCVLAVALELFDAGLTVHIASEACASSEGDDNHVAGLQILRRAVGVWNVDPDPREDREKELTASLRPHV